MLKGAEMAGIKRQYFQKGLLGRLKFTQAQMGEADYILAINGTFAFGLVIDEKRKISLRPTPA